MSFDMLKKMEWHTTGLVALACIVMGCGDSGPDTVDVSGRITLNGKPLAGAEINFIAEKFAGYAVTDDQGEFSLVNGAVAGLNKITISKIDGAQVAEGEGMDAGQFAAMSDSMGGRMPGKIARQLLPVDYTDPFTSGLSFEVPDGGTDSANFDLTVP